ncbi:Hypothetical protein NTJ_04258 [Nesidiocoris tenuis]|uniref:Uncharacterized protein n=1 Tax=Nesidiocoris tenuis TaxID=355587 RepID=A0ABN7AGQ6_9HEMI|nr:Hypothetical protein NTJ_04258 [Nesidiocoris tenuis]
MRGGDCPSLQNADGKRSVSGFGASTHRNTSVRVVLEFGSRRFPGFMTNRRLPGSSSLRLRIGYAAQTSRT